MLTLRKPNRRIRQISRLGGWSDYTVNRLMTGVFLFLLVVCAGVELLWFAWLDKSVKNHGAVIRLLMDGGVGFLLGVCAVCALWWLLLRSGGASWLLGTSGENLTAHTLRKLGKLWTLAHCVPFVVGDEEPVDVDHILIGPPGIFVISTRYRTGTSQGYKFCPSPTMLQVQIDANDTLYYCQHYVAPLLGVSSDRIQAAVVYWGNLAEPIYPPIRVDSDSEQPASTSYNMYHDTLVLTGRQLRQLIDDLKQRQTVLGYIDINEMAGRLEAYMSQFMLER